MSKEIRKSSRTPGEYYRGRHRFEHWYVDNQVYFLTGRVRGRRRAFAREEAKIIFWDRFDHYTKEAGFVPWVTTLMDNHYHVLGYLRDGSRLPKMMQRIHGSVAKLVNDVLEASARPAPARPAPARPALAGRAPGGTAPGRIVPFWRDTRGREYFDGCIRDEKQCRLAYRYTLKQSQRHGVCDDYRRYPHTRVVVELEAGVKRSHALGAFLEGVPYKRYRPSAAR